MKDKLYLQDRKNLLNRKDEDQNVIYDECQSGPMEEENLVLYDVDIDKFLAYEQKVNEKNKKKFDY